MKRLVKLLIALSICFPLAAVAGQMGGQMSPSPDADTVDGQHRVLTINADHTHASTGAMGGILTAPVIPNLDTAKITSGRLIPDREASQNAVYAWNTVVATVTCGAEVFIPFDNEVDFSNVFAPATGQYSVSNYSGFYLVYLRLLATGTGITGVTINLYSDTTNYYEKKFSEVIDGNIYVEVVHLAWHNTGTVLRFKGIVTGASGNCYLNTNSSQQQRSFLYISRLSNH